MKRKAGLLGAVVLALLSLAAYLLSQNTHPALPSSFALHLSQDATSSGGSRYTTADLSYTQNILARGTLTYVHSRETTSTTTCAFADAGWIAPDGSPCAISFIEIPQSVREVETLMASGKIKPLGDSCQHFEICYTLGKNI